MDRPDDTWSPRPVAKSEALERFLASMILDVDKWRDGEPYDLDALGEITPAERTHVLAVLQERLAGSGADWRDVDAVAALGIRAADTLLRRCAWHADAAVRLRAAPLLAARGDATVVERELLRILRDRESNAPIEATMRLAEEHPSEPVKQALLVCAIHGAPHLRVHAAALALYLAGVAKDAFDWDHRPLFLQFGEDDESVRVAALGALRSLMKS